LQNTKSPSDWMKQLEDRARAVSLAQGCEFYDLEFITAGSRVLRIYIDKKDGIGVEDCASVSRGINEFLDENDIIPGGEYQLEVSSPGADRSLKTLSHYQSVIGRRIGLQLRQALGLFGVEIQGLINAKKIEAVLVSAELTNIEIEVQEQKIIIPVDQIERAKLLLNLDPLKPKPKPGGPKNKTKH
jgi:ribosome maturation factor RimP